MGGGLLQRLNRDTLSLATKLSHIVYADGTGETRVWHISVQRGWVTHVMRWQRGACSEGSRAGVAECPHPARGL